MNLGVVTLTSWQFKGTTVWGKTDLILPAFWNSPLNVVLLYKCFHFAADPSVRVRAMSSMRRLPFSVPLLFVWELSERKEWIDIRFYGNTHRHTNTETHTALCEELNLLKDNQFALNLDRFGRIFFFISFLVMRWNIKLWTIKVTRVKISLYQASFAFSAMDSGCALKLVMFSNCRAVIHIYLFLF